MDDPFWEEEAWEGLDDDEVEGILKVRELLSVERPQDYAVDENLSELERAVLYLSNGLPLQVNFSTCIQRLIVTISNLSADTHDTHKTKTSALWNSLCNITSMFAHRSLHSYSQMCTALICPSLLFLYFRILGQMRSRNIGSATGQPFATRSSRERGEFIFFYSR